MPVDNVLAFRKMISELEDKKWEILLKKGDLSASKEWPVIERKLTMLYRWWSKEMGTQIRPYIPRKLR